LEIIRTLKRFHNQLRNEKSKIFFFKFKKNSRRVGRSFSLPVISYQKDEIEGCAVDILRVSQSEQVGEHARCQHAERQEITQIGPFSNESTNKNTRGIGK